MFCELEKKALRHRQVWLWGDLDHELSYEITAALSYLGRLSREPIYLLINSEGGNVEAEFSIIDEIVGLQEAGIVVSTIANGQACSAGADILALGTKGYRMARPHSSIMLHPTSFGLEHDYEGNHRNRIQFYDKQSCIIHRELAAACGMTDKYEVFLNDIDKGLWLTAEEAVKYGVIDSILKGPLPIGGRYGDKQTKICDR